MTPQELLNLCVEQDTLGLDRLILTMPWPKSWSRNHMSSTVRTPFGNCRWYPTGDNKKIMIYPTTKQVLRFIKREVLPRKKRKK